jgi:hypothetical protein
LLIDYSRSFSTYSILLEYLKCFVGNNGIVRRVVGKTDISWTGKFQFIMELLSEIDSRSLISFLQVVVFAGEMSRWRNAAEAQVRPTENKRD